MATKPLEEKVIEIVAAHFEKPTDVITAEMKYRQDLGADSLDENELAMKFEEAFEIEVPDDAAARTATIGESVAFIEKMLRKGAVSRQL